MLIFATIINLISSYLIASISCEFVVLFLAFFALIILNLEILSLFSAINPLNIIILSIVFLFFAFFFFKKKSSKFLTCNFDFKRFKNAIFMDKSLFILSFAFLFLLFITFFLATTIPVLEPDSQTYHFLRAWEFAKNHSLNHFETTDIRALIMPINSEILYTFMYVFKKNLYGYGIVSYISFLVLIFTSWQIGDFFKIPFRKRLWAIFIFSSLSAIIVQISSLQTDVLVGCLFLMTLYLYLKNKIYFSSLALAIAFGVKTSGLIGMFGIFFIIFGWEFLINKKYENLKKFSLFLILNFLIFSSYNYFLNLIQFHSPFSNTAAYLGHRFSGGIKGYLANLINFSFQSLDFTGFKWGFYLNDRIIGLRDGIFEFLNIPQKLRGNIPMEILNIQTDEQVIGFGILGFLIFLPCVFYFSVKLFYARNKKNIFFGLLATSFLINIFLLARSVGYMIYSIRFICAFVAVSFLILCATYKKKSILKPFIIFFCLFYMICMPLYIKRMPYFYTVKLLKELNYDKEKFSQAAYEGKLINILEIAPAVYDTIKNKYFDYKKIAYIRGTVSSVLYLTTLEKDGHSIDFLNTYRLSDDKLKKYDLIIVEKEVQDDNIFNPEDIEINYKVEDKKVFFNDLKGMYCYYVALGDEIAITKDNVIKRMCFAKDYISKRKFLKEDFRQKVTVKELDDESYIYYFINQIKD